MKNLKDQKGITLVALVITIIVLLILAGVSLQLVVGDTGILGRAQRAGEMQGLGGIRDQVELEVANLGLEYYEKANISEAGAGSGINSVGAYIKANLSADNIEGVDDLSVGDIDGNHKYEVSITIGTGADAKTYKGKIEDSTGKWSPAIDITNPS